MRIIIESNGSAQSVQTSSDMAEGIADGGAAGDQVAADFQSATAERSPIGNSNRENAGTPPAWLLAAVTKEYERGGERFDRHAIPESDVSDGGGASHPSNGSSA